MNVTLYTNTGDVRQLTKNLTNAVSVTCKVTDNCDMLAPVLILDYNDAYISSNYVHIPKWNRYYTITGKTILNGGMMEVSCKCDVLMSHRNAILNSQIIAARSASSPEPFIPDPVCPDKGTVTYYTRRASATPFGTSGSYVLTVAGK